MAIDIFIAYADEDRAEVARPLAQELEGRGFRVFYAEHVLGLGDSLRRKIDHAIASCQFGVVVLSEHFFRKEWPQRELDSLAARELDEGSSRILPVLHKVGHKQVLAFSPFLADKIGIPTARGLKCVADAIEKVLRAAKATKFRGKRVSLLFNYTVFDAQREGCPECGGEVQVVGSAGDSGEYVIGICQACGWHDSHR